MKGATGRNYLLGVLLVIYAFNNVDRMALALLLQSIKGDLHLSDTQLGALTGIAFALFYSIMGLPIARLVDFGNRISIISITTALWSVAVMFCGSAGTFLQLLLIRVGVAVGESGCVPAAYSLISDYFSRAERPRAIATYLQGGTLSILIGYCAAGWLNQLYGWRTTFVALGAPGVGLAFLAAISLREPRRSVTKDSLNAAGATESGDVPGPTEGRPSVKVVCATLYRNRSFRRLLLFYSIASFFNVGIVHWQQAFFVRSFGLSTGELGTWMAVVSGVGVMLGIYLGGHWASRYAANMEDVQLKVLTVTYCGVGALSAAIYLVPDKYAAFALVGLWNLAGTTASGPLFATIQSLVPERMRATSVAIMYFCANLIGMGFGPLAVGILSDALHPWVGQESLRYSLLAVCPGYLWGAWYLWTASGTVIADIEAQRKVEEREAALLVERVESSGSILPRAEFARK